MDVRLDVRLDGECLFICLECDFVRVLHFGFQETDALEDAMYSFAI